MLGGFGVNFTACQLHLGYLEVKWLFVNYMILRLA